MSVCINPNCPNPQNQDTLLFCSSCGSELLLDGRYRVMRQLGGGGFGKTYEIRDSTPNNVQMLSEFKVLKVLIHNHPKYVELFQREAQFLSRLNHPGIPKVESDAYFTFQPHNVVEPLHCLVMEKIEGMDLKDYITQRGTCITEKRAIQWLIQLTKILREIHSHNFFHRDIKPSNIMLRAEGQLVLIDFGTAREVTETYMSKQSAGQVTGLFSAGYSPLEQLNGQALPQSDFFALGRTFVYLLTGKHPGELYDSYVDELHWREHVSDISPQFADFIDHMMARLPSQRPQSAEVILQELRAIYHDLYESEGNSQGTQPLASPLVEETQASSEEIDLEHPDFKITQSSENISPPASPLIPSPQPIQPPGVANLSESAIQLDPLFISRCQEELAEFIGPMASIICQRVLRKQSNLSPTEFVKALAHNIPDHNQAMNFQKRLLR